MVRIWPALCVIVNVILTRVQSQTALSILIYPSVLIYLQIFHRRNCLDKCDKSYACNETRLMHYLSSLYLVTILLHVSGLLVAHNHAVTMYICDNWYVLYVLVDLWPADSQLKRTTHTIYRIYTIYMYIITSWWWATRKPEICRCIVTE
jgi:hypothetical protein